MSSASSIHDLAPLETGGVQNRTGIDVQDHVAASFCLHMWGEAALKAVWCETQDDIALIWDLSGVETVEFVQVKNNQLDQLWSMAELCKPDGASVKKDGTSIFERSLAYDRCKEPCSFRIITSRPMNNLLEILQYAVNSEARRAPCPGLEALHAEFAKRDNAQKFRSANNNSYVFWLSRTVWQVVHEKEAVRAKNLIALSKVVESLGELIVHDHLNELYEKLVRKVYNAALAGNEQNRAAKKILRGDFISWLRNAVQAIVHPLVMGGGKARKKMKDAGIAPETIKSALEEKTSYRQEKLTQKYLKLEDQRRVELEVQAVLHSLKADLDAGMLTDSGTQFHARCLTALETIRTEFPEGVRPSRAFVQGCMYGMADRCVHRFTKATA